MDIGLEHYLPAHIGTEGNYLYRLYRVTNIHTVHGRMMNGHLQGRLLKVLMEMIRLKSILGVGTFSGYSVICMVEGLGEDGQLYTSKINDKMKDFTQSRTEDSPAAPRIQLIIGDTNAEAPKLNVVFDVALINDDKRTYIETSGTVLKLLRPDGFILADNASWDGYVTDPHRQHDQQTQGIAHPNDLIAQDARVEKVILPIRDGLTVTRKESSR